MRDNVWVWKAVFRNWNYLILGIAIAFAFNEVNAVITHWEGLGFFCSAFGFSIIIVSKDSTKCSSCHNKLPTRNLKGGTEHE